MGVLKYYNEATSSWEQAIVGVQGATGATGPTGGIHLHAQTSPSTLWVVNHNLGQTYVNVEPVDSSNQSFVGRYDYPVITFVNDYTLTLSFPTPQTGWAAISLGGMGATGPSLPYQTETYTPIELITGPVQADDIDIGQVYRIYTIGNTDWTALGAASNTIGTIFTATATGGPSDTGTAQALVSCYVDLSLAYTTGQNLVCVYDVNNYMTGVVESYNPGTGLLEFFATGGINHGTQSYATTSSTSVTLGVGSQTFTVGINLAYTAGQDVTIALASNQNTYMAGTVTSYNAGTGQLVVSVDTFTGSGTYSSWLVNPTWEINIFTPQGATGLTGATGATGPQGPTGATYLHTQVTPSTIWYVNHNLNSQYVNVEPIDDFNNSYVGRYDYPVINFVDNDNLTLTFTTPVTGKAAVSAGGPDGATGATGLTGATGVAGVAQNVLYVSKSGNDANAGTDLTHAKLTIAAAVAEANLLQAANPSGMTCIFVKAGDYTEINPISLAAGVSIVGDNLRAVSVRPANPTQDIFWVRNRCYLTGMTFRDHLDPAAAVAFPSTGAGFIVTSPYVQNCSSITTTGAGMRVDGNLAGGLRSMVLDSYTQFNQGGLGIHITNQGYAQLVSIFTICCTAGVKCENGGTCSITNSNNSFGDYGLWADGVGPTLYSGTLVSNTRDTLTISGLTTRPAVNDAVLITDGVSTQYILVRQATPLAAGVSVITFSEDLLFTPTPGPVNFMQISLISASSQTFEYVGTGTNILTSTPRLGGVPIQANEIRQTNGGRVNYTSTDQFGDFRIGDGLLISEEAGVIEGTTFDRSLFAVLTPYILALEG